MFDQNFTTILATDPYSQEGKKERQVKFQRKVSISVIYYDKEVLRKAY